MEKLVLILLSLIFGYLFYEQTFGINVLIMVPILILVSKKTVSVFNGYTVAFIISGIAVFINPGVASVSMFFAAFFVFLSKHYNPNLAIYLSAFNGSIMAVVGGINYLTNERKEVKKTPTNTKFWLITLSIVIPVCVIFISLYRNSNSVFDNLISQIDLSFVNIGFLFTALLGAFLLFNVQHPMLLNEMQDLENQTPNDLTIPELPFGSSLLKKLKNEHLQASILIGALNLILCMFLATELVVFNQGTEAIEFKEQVHGSIYTLIVSIIFAIVIIAIYFRGNLNFYKENTILKNLSIGWIVLNVILVFSAAYKNYLYIYNFGLTYKRIGVFIYLSLVILGLFYTFFKIKEKKSLWYVIKRVSLLSFFIFSLLSTVPYSKLITWYNINQSQTFGYSYLLELPSDNAVLLWKYKNIINKRTGKDNTQQLLQRINIYKSGLQTKSWQSFKLDNILYYEAEKIDVENYELRTNTY